MASALDPEVLPAEHERQVPATLPETHGKSVDAQVTTAHRFPRNITDFTRTATELATLTEDVAKSCVYALPRGGKTIEGPSARLAEIVAHAWKNLRIQAGVVEQDGRFITARGEAWDVESNVAIAFEVRRRITDREAKTFNDDMTVVAGNAAASIALRNAVFKVVPTSFWRPIYLKCRNVIAGDAKTFASRRDDMLKAFAVMGVLESRICDSLGVKSKADITLEHMVTLTGFFNALKEGETTIEEAFPEGGGPALPQAARRRSEPKPEVKAPAAKAADSSPAELEPEPTPRAQSPSVGTLVRVHARPNGGILELSTGYKAATKDAELLKAAEGRVGRTVELVTRPSSDPAKYAPTLEEIIDVSATGGDEVE